MLISGWSSLLKLSEGFVKINTGKIVFLLELS